MLMQKIRDNAAWVVVIAVVCFVALIFVDWGMSPGNNMTQKTVIGSVAGEDLRFEEFDQLVQQKAKEQTEQGQELTSENYAQLRRQVFETMVQEQLFRKVVAQYNLEGTPEQVLDYLRRNPPPGADKAPIFMGPDSQFSKALYEQWLANPRAFDDRYMQAIEAHVTGRVVPQRALSYLLGGTQPTTELETNFLARRENTRAWGMAVVAAADSFPVSTPSDADVKKEYDAHPDSFFVGKASATIPSVAFSKAPSHADSANARADADTVAARLSRGEDFAELAKQYSEDPGSAKNGGSLGGYQPVGRWVPQFAAAAKTLEVGKISGTIASPFGYHIIKNNGRKVEGADTLYDLSHILIRVTTSPETIDSLKALLDSVRTLVKGGASFANAAKAIHATIDSARVEEGEIGTTAQGPIPGASAWAFHPQNDEKTSEVLESSTQLLVFGSAVVQKAGRRFELAKDHIKSRLMQRAAAAQAATYLTSVMPKVQACDTTEACVLQIGKLAGTRLVGRPSESWIAGLGYAPPELLGAWNKASQTPKTWAGPLATGKGGVAVRIDSLEQATPEELAKAFQQRRASNVQLGDLMQDYYLKARRVDAKVKNNLDRFYRD